MKSYFRMSGFGLLALLSVGAIGVLSPPQLGVLLLKLAEITSGAFLGYWIDRHSFPYARPHIFTELNTNRGMAMVRRAIIVAATTIAIAIAL